MQDTGLEPNAFYWARSKSHFDGEITVVQVSTTFGSEPDFWTLALLGTDQHAMLADFEIVGVVEPLHIGQINLAAE